jgi:hypothetical protein
MYPRNIRYFFENRGLKRFARLLRRILSKTLTISIVFLCAGYVFATIGLFLYGGLINKSPISNEHYDQLVTSRYGVAGYYPLNFNDFMSACITLFCCLHVSDFDIIASGFTATTSEDAKVYFALWYVVGVLLMLNILKSFFLGEFLALFLVPGADSPLSKGGTTETSNTQENEPTDASEKEGMSELVVFLDAALPSKCYACKNSDETGEAEVAPMDARETFVLDGPSPAGRFGNLHGRPIVGGMQADADIANRRQESHTSENSNVALTSSSRQASMAGSSRQISRVGEHEFDEEQYKKISLTRCGSSGMRSLLSVWSILLYRYMILVLSPTSSSYTYSVQLRPGPQHERQHAVLCIHC